MRPLARSIDSVGQINIFYQCLISSKVNRCGWSFYKCLTSVEVSLQPWATRILRPFWNSNMCRQDCLANPPTW